MDPIRPSRGKARGRPQIPINQPGISSLTSSLPQGIRGPRPTILQPTQSSQPLQAPTTGVGMQRPPRLMPPRPPGTAPQQRAPRPLGPRPGITSDTTASKNDPMEGVRIYFQFHNIYTYIYVQFFFKVQQVTEGLKTLGTGNVFSICIILLK
jgi:hypothetical protein